MRIQRSGSGRVVMHNRGQVGESELKNRLAMRCDAVRCDVMTDAAGSETVHKP